MRHSPTKEAAKTKPDADIIDDDVDLIDDDPTIDDELLEEEDAETVSLDEITDMPSDKDE